MYRETICLMVTANPNKRNQRNDSHATGQTHVLGWGPGNLGQIIPIDASYKVNRISKSDFGPCKRFNVKIE